MRSGQRLLVADRNRLFNGQMVRDDQGFTAHRGIGREQELPPLRRGRTLVALMEGVLIRQHPGIDFGIEGPRWFAECRQNVTAQTKTQLDVGQAVGGDEGDIGPILRPDDQIRIDDQHHIIAGDSVFVLLAGASGKLGIGNGTVEVFRADPGAAVGRMLRDPAFSKVGLMDMVESLRAFRRTYGEYVVIIEEDHAAKNLMYRWRAP